MNTAAIQTSAAFSQSRLGRLGPISQIAYVPDDFDKSLHHWSQVMGVGPFLMLDRVAAVEGTYMGKPSDVHFAAAVGYWGDMQIELIKQTNDAPSAYLGFRNHPEGDRMHHFCLTVPDLDHACKVVADGGGKVVQTCTLYGGTRFVYAEQGAGGPAQFLEIAQVSDMTRSLMTWLRELSRDWDGSDPVRSPPRR